MAIEFGPPSSCAIGEDCFLQQFPDMAAGTAVADPFCGGASYDGHDGTDLRIRSLSDEADVVAMADGIVLRARDGEEDRLVITDEDRRRIADRECGNGLVIEHAEGFQTQYCHLRRGSLAVAAGEGVTRGTRIGAIGASGLAAFPHVHVTVRQRGTKVDPFSGKEVGAGCGADAAKPLFEQSVLDAAADGETQLLGFGLAGGAVDHAGLSVSGPPPAATSASTALVAWAWFINMRKDDRIRFEVVGPDGNAVVSHVADPLDRNKASFAGFAGKRGMPAAGKYRVEVGILRRDGAVAESEQTVSID